MTENSNRWFFIINPASGNGTAKKQWQLIEQALNKEKIPFQNAFTDRKLHAVLLVQEALQNGFRKIVGVGGDGTNNEIVNGILQQKNIPSSSIIYTLFPIGTGNDWIKHYAIPSRLKAWIEMLKAEHSVLQDVGKTSYHQKGKKQERYFVNVAGMAYDGFVGKALNENKGLFLKRLRYLYLGVTCLFQYKLRKARIEFDEQIVEDYFYLINAGICKYSGGGMQMVPHAIANDGQLALTIARNLSKANVLKSLPLLYNGKIGKHPLITLHQTKSVKITALDDSPTMLEVDGEFLGETPVEISILENALRVVVPKA